jgi:hypothetical protein
MKSAFITICFCCLQLIAAASAFLRPHALASNKHTGSFQTIYLHNFGPASFRDDVLFTSERPGNNKTNSIIEDDKVQAWIAYMKEKKINHVLCLLDKAELDDYESDLLFAYKQAGLQCTVQPLGSDRRAAFKVFQILSAAEQRAEKVVAHCTGGVGRSGRVAGMFVFMRLVACKGDQGDYLDLL